MHPGVILLNVLKIVSYPCKIAGSMMSMHVCQVFEMWEAIKIQKYYFWRRGDGLLTFLIFHKIIEIKGFLYPLVMINFVIYPKVAVFPYFLMN